MNAIKCLLMRKEVSRIFLSACCVFPGKTERLKKKKNSVDNPVGLATYQYLVGEGVGGH